MIRWYLGDDDEVEISIESNYDGTFSAWDAAGRDVTEQVPERQWADVFRALDEADERRAFS